MRPAGWAALHRPVGDVVSHGLSNQPFRMSMQGFTPWSPQRPHLYNLTIKMGDDLVQSYFGMRKFSAGKDEKGIPRLFLNGEPFFFNGVLDQAIGRMACTPRPAMKPWSMTSRP